VVNGAAPNPEYGRVVGIRNAHDKSVAAGICAGASVMVCANLSFSGEIQFARKHTSQVMRHLPGIVDRAIELLRLKWTFQDLRFEAYKERELSPERVHDLTVKALDEGAICASRIPRVLHEYRNPSHEEFAEPTVWSFFNAVTETNKGTNLMTLPRRTMKLHAVCDKYAGVN
jgi:hypothetical protein